ncbi:MULTISPECIES: MFS transporter [unclassified Ochrobactrum]|uniref:MFS transporter n=1 Tax=unclassified Ochrobactrum TaxID=239106 RepID=UPI0015FADD50|nr:MFS family permease [Ochrobactrum sp. RH2CCR150]MDH7787175.1 MFS family permease [Ochrobactrum sp. 19YEA23]
MFQWYRELNAPERKTFHACYVGWATDALDTQLFSFLIPTLVALWAITNSEAGWLGTSALISSSIGGWIAGIMCDRIGRVTVMKIAIAWFTVFTIASGFANSYEQLLVARILSGIGFGGEWAAGAVLMGEVIRPAYRGKAVGNVQSAYAVGYGFAALLSSVLFATMPPENAWRWMFWIGALPAFWVFWGLRGVEEPEVFLKTRKALADRGEKISPFVIFHPRYLKTTILCSLLALGIQGGGFSILIWLPTFLKSHYQISSVTVGYYVFVMTFGSFVGYIVAAYLCDLIGRRRNFFLFTVLNWIIIPIFLYTPPMGALSLVINFMLGFSLLGIYAALGPYFTELFPNTIRGNGQAFCYNFGRAAGAFGPAIVGMMATGSFLPLRDAMALCAMLAYIFVLVAVALLPETNGRDLSFEDDQPIAGKEDSTVGDASGTQTI